MNVLPLIKEFCPNKIPFTPTTCLGGGADGETFLIKEDKSKVIKLCVLYDHSEEVNIFDYYSNISSILNQLMTTLPRTYVHVYKHDYLGSFVQRSRFSSKEFILYYYVMEKLLPLSLDEDKLFYSILSHEDKNIVKNYSMDKIKNLVGGLSSGLDFDAGKVIFFCENLKNSPISHLDMDSRNIMKDATGYFKLVDLDRLKENDKKIYG